MPARHSPASPADGPQIEPALGGTVLVLAGCISPGDVPGLCERGRSLIEDCPRGDVVCDVSGLEAPDMAAVDALTRLQLLARRRGNRICLRGVTPELCGLLELVGLASVLRVCG